MTHKSAKRKPGRPVEGTGVQVSIIVPPWVAERLDVLAKEQRRSRSSAAALLLEDALGGAKATA